MNALKPFVSIRKDQVACVLLFWRTQATTRQSLCPQTHGAVTPARTRSFNRVSVGKPIRKTSSLQTRIGLFGDVLEGGR